MIKVLIVDDSALMRGWVARALNRADGICVVGECGDGIEVPEIAAAVQPDVVLMDVVMRQRSGIDATRDLLAHRPSARVLMLTSSTDVRVVAEAADAGAVGYLVKSGDPHVLVSAVRIVAAGGTAWHTDIHSKVIGRCR